MHNSEKSTEVCSPFNDLCDSSVLPQPVTFSVSVLEVCDLLKIISVIGFQNLLVHSVLTFSG